MCAARQAARDLAGTLGVLSETVGVFVESGVEREEAGRLVALQQAAVERCRAHPLLSSLEASDLEDALGDALDALGVGADRRAGALQARSGASGCSRPSGMNGSSKRSSAANHSAASLATGSSSTPLPTRLTRTRSPWKRNSAGSRTA